MPDSIPILVPKDSVPILVPNDSLDCAQVSGDSLCASTDVASYFLLFSFDIRDTECCIVGKNQLMPDSISIFVPEDSNSIFVQNFPKTSVLFCIKFFFPVSCVRSLS
jgi:hypothetical protein